MNQTLAPLEHEAGHQACRIPTGQQRGPRKPSGGIKQAKPYQHPQTKSESFKRPQIQFLPNQVITKAFAPKKTPQKKFFPDFM
jgi:hypothetical protein